MEKLKQYFNGKNSVTGATGILIVTLTLSNILGMLRDHYLAQKIPTSLLDTYYAAFRLPDLIFNLLVLGAISAAFIPVFTSYISKGEEKEAWKVVNSFLNLSIIALIIFAALLAILMPYLIPIMVSNFSPDKQDLTIKLARLMLLSPIFFGISYIFGGILNSFKRFLVYSIAPLVYNLSIIISTLVLADKFNVWGVVFGVIIGAFLHMLVQIPIAIKLGYKYQPIFNLNHEGVKKIFRLMIPRTIGLGAMQIMLLVFTYLASTLSPGSVAIYSLADNIQTMPGVVFGTSFATAIFPSLSEAASLKKTNQFNDLLWRGIRAMLYLLIPAGIGIILLRAQIVRLILGSGFFGWDQTINTANTLGYLAISLFAQGLISLLARSFYALHNTKIPMIIGLISFLTSIILALIFAPIMGVSGLGLAFSIGSILNALLLYISLRKYSQQIQEQEHLIVIFLAKVIFASLFMIIAVQSSKYLIGSNIDMTRFWGVFVQTIVAIVFGSSVYIFFTWILGCEEINEISYLFKKRFKIGTTNNEEQLP